MDAARLFQEHHQELSRYLLRYTGDPELAADAAQEAFTRLLDNDPDDDAVRSWLFTVATNVVRDQWRARKRHAELLAAAVDRVPQSDASPGADRRLESEEKRAAVQEALLTLSEKERTALLMREEGFTQREIAEAVGTTTKSVGTLTIRAMRKLAGRIQLDPEDI